MAVIAGLSAVVGVSELLRPVYLDNPGMRVAIELTMTLCAIASAGLLLAALDGRRRLTDRLLFATFTAVALVETVFAVSALTGTHGAEPSAALRLGSEALLAVAFAALALVPTWGLRSFSRGTFSLRSVIRGTAALVGGACVAAVAFTELIAELTSGRAAAGQGLAVSGMAAAARHPLTLALVLASSAALGTSAITFLRRASRGGGDGEARLLAGASILLAAATPYLAFPMAAADWATSGDALRAVAYALLLAVAVRRCVAAKRLAAETAARAAVEAERIRIARDLHDGLAQDLAFIANQGQRLRAELGPDNLVWLAARRALAAARGAIVDLSATDAPTAGAALRQVAEELEARFEIRVDVRVFADAGDSDAAGLSISEREEVVRIAREAIANAVRHGGADRVEVVLDCRGGSLLLRVSDDGCGMPDDVPASAPSAGGGFGLPTMHARAESLGGHLTARRAALGGTELEVVVSS